MEKVSFDESLVAELENIVVAAMEDPDDQITTMSHTSRLTEDYSVDVKLMTYTAGALPYGVAGRSNRLFLCHDTAIAQTPGGLVDVNDMPCRRPVIFSALYTNEEGEQSFGGMSGSMPALPPSLMTRGPLEVDAVALTRQLTAQFSEGDHYDIEPGDSQWDQKLIEDFNARTARVVADGAFLRTSYMTRDAADGETTVFAAYQTRSGDMRYVSQEDIEYPYLRFSVSDDDIETVYERSIDGRVDVKTRIADELIRYAGLASYKSIYFEGEQIAASYDQAEINALEAEERAQGLYIPTKENMAILMKYAVLLQYPES